MFLSTSRSSVDRQDASRRIALDGTAGSAGDDHSSAAGARKPELHPGPLPLLLSMVRPPPDWAAQAVHHGEPPARCPCRSLAVVKAGSVRLGKGLVVHPLARVGDWSGAHSGLVPAASLTDTVSAAARRDGDHDRPRAWRRAH